MENKLYVGNLPYGATEEDVKAHFREPLPLETSVAGLFAAGEGEGDNRKEKQSGERLRESRHGRQFYGEDATNWVYRSRNPFNFGIDDDSKIVLQWKLAAPEVDDSIAS